MSSFQQILLYFQCSCYLVNSFKKMSGRKMEKSCKKMEQSGRKIWNRMVGRYGTACYEDREHSGRKIWNIVVGRYGVEW